MFVDNSIIDFDSHYLTRNINRGDHVLVSRFRRQLESFAEHIEDSVAPDEPNQVVAARVWLGQRAPRCVGPIGKANYFAALFKGRLGCSTLQFSVSITAVMMLLKQQRLLFQILHAFHRDPPQETISEVIIELFHYAISPRLRHWDEPRLDLIEQAQPDQIAHSSRMPSATKEHKLIVHLLMLRHPQTAPDRPDSIYRVLASFAQYWADCAPSRSQIHTVQAVESHRSAQITRTDIIRLVHLIHTIRCKRRVLLSFWFVSSGSSMCKLFSTENPIDRSQRRQRLDPQLHQLPFDCLCTAEQPLIVETQPYQLDCVNNLFRQLVCMPVRARRSPFVPDSRVFATLATFYPLIDPLPRTPQRSRNRRDALAVRTTLYSQNSVTLCFRPHRRLQKRSRRQCPRYSRTAKVKDSFFKELSTMYWH